MIGKDRQFGLWLALVLVFVFTSLRAQLHVGAERFDLYGPLLEGRSVAVVANQTSRVGEAHLVDYLQYKEVDVKSVFAPEHGFRGNADAGEHVKDGIDLQSGLPLYSLYGSSKKPSAELLQNIDVVIFDIQDVGVRFYTYISTMHYVMEACAEQGKEMIVLDRPNPNDHYIDGPVLDIEFQSFVGMHPIPLVHGLTVGELANMIKGEGWINEADALSLTVIPVSNYAHGQEYQLVVQPSPNLPNMQSIYLYPSLGLFEGTIVSAGRGTDIPFQCFGHPRMDSGNIVFTPLPNEGATSPRYKGKECVGFDLSSLSSKDLRSYGAISLHWLELSLNDLGSEHFFYKNNFFDLLAGTDQLRNQLLEGQTLRQIRESWQPALDEYKAMRKNYLLYDEGEQLNEYPVNSENY